MEKEKEIQSTVDDMYYYLDLFSGKKPVKTKK